MSNFWSRVLVLLVIFPILAVVIVILPFQHHLFFNLCVVFIAFLGSREMNRMLQKKGFPIFRFLSPLLSATLPAVAYLEEIELLPQGAFVLGMAAVLTVFFTMAVAARDEATLRQRLPLLSGATLTLFVPAFFLSFIVRLTSLRRPDLVLLCFLLSVFMNDMFAYLGGMLARGKTRLHLPVSPNKSLIGFICGFIASIGVTVLFSFLAKDAYTLSPPAAVLLGVVMAVTANVGDLFESALKRSCQIKDSGILMGGRGGILDAIDSLLLSAPCFLVLFPLLAQPV